MVKFVTLPKYTKSELESLINTIIEASSRELNRNLHLEQYTYTIENKHIKVGFVLQYVDNGTDMFTNVSTTFIQTVRGLTPEYGFDAAVDKIKYVITHNTDSEMVEATSMIIKKKQRIVAADEDEFIGDEDSDLLDSIDDIADQVEDVQDQIDELDEDEIDIELENNIDDHYIAECDRCHGVFISAMIENDEEIDHITGTCPLCGKETNQYLKWIIRSISEE